MIDFRACLNADNMPRDDLPMDAPLVDWARNAHEPTTIASSPSQTHAQQPRLLDGEFRNGVLHHARTVLYRESTKQR